MRTKLNPHTHLRLAILQYLSLRYPGRGWFHHNLGGLGVVRGLPDITGCLDGRYIGIECKTGSAVLSRHQEAVHKRIIKAGGLVVVARSLDDVIDLLHTLEAKQ